MGSWDEPMRLLFPDPGNKLQLNQDTVKKLSEITSQLTIVSITGLYRTGKSFCLNRIARKLGQKSHIEPGFPVSPSMDAQTKGIWVWYLQSENEPDNGVLLLDTEGLGDPSGGDVVYDYRIMCISVLLSSVFIYNASGEIDLSAIDKLKFVADVTKKITIEDCRNRKIDHAVFFPTFVLLARNFQSEFLIDQQPVTEDEYMERKMFSLNRNLKEESNNLTATMRNCFLTRKCFALPYPCVGKKIKILNTLPDEELDSDFVEDFDKFFNYVCNSEFKKKLNYVDYVNGKRFLLLVNQYVDQVNNENMVLVDRATLDVAKTENESAVTTSIKLYDNIMKNTLSVRSSLTSILNAHGDCAVAATKHFIYSRMEDDNATSYQNFQKNMRKEYAKIVKTVIADDNGLEASNDNSNLEKLKENLLKELASCLDENLENTVFGILDQVPYHKIKFGEIEKECDAVLRDDQQKRKETVEKSLTTVVKQKEQELVRLNAEGFGQSDYYEQIVQQIFKWKAILVELAPLARELVSIYHALVGR